MQVDFSLSSWTSPLDASGQVDEAGFLRFYEGNGDDWHLLSVDDARFAEEWLNLTIIFRPAQSCSALFHVNLIDGQQRVVCSVDHEGRVVNQGISESAHCIPRDDGFFQLTTTYLNVSNSIAFGSAMADGPYAGLGRHQFDIASIAVEIDRPQQVSQESLLTYVDVGARYGRTHELKQLRRQVRVVMFEPDPEGAAPLYEEAKKYPGTVVVQRALFSANGPKTLFITAGNSCSSLLLPNHEFLKKYEIGHLFEVVRQIEVECVRYDTLHTAGEVPAPDAIKIDVQGTEIDVLEGFGGLLADCIGIELETHIYPIYHQEKLLSDIAQFLMRFDLMLVRLLPQKHFDNDLVEFNAWFLKRPRWFEGRSPALLEKLATLKQIWFL